MAGPPIGCSPCHAPAYPALSTIEVECVDGVLACVVVVVGAAARDGISLQKPAEGGDVQARAHQGDTGEVVGLALLGAKPAVAGTGSDAGDAELGRLEGGQQAGGGGVQAGAGDGVTV
jgi:hypothetical protein